MRLSVSALVRRYIYSENPDFGNMVSFKIKLSLKLTQEENLELSQNVCFPSLACLACSSLLLVLALTLVFLGNVVGTRLTGCGGRSLDHDCAFV